MITEERLAALERRVRRFATGALIDSAIPAAGDLEQSEMAQSLRSRYLADQAKTHWPGCWRDHYQCAMRRIEALEEAETALDQINGLLSSSDPKAAIAICGVVADYYAERGIGEHR